MTGRGVTTARARLGPCGDDRASARRQGHGNRLVRIPFQLHRYRLRVQGEQGQGCRVFLIEGDENGTALYFHDPRGGVAELLEDDEDVRGTPGRAREGTDGGTARRGVGPSGFVCGKSPRRESLP